MGFSESKIAEEKPPSPTPVQQQAALDVSQEDILRLQQQTNFQEVEVISLLSSLNFSARGGLFLYLINTPFPRSKPFMLLLMRKL